MILVFGDRRGKAWFLIDRVNCAVAMTALEARPLWTKNPGWDGYVMPIVCSAPKAPKLKTGPVSPLIAYRTQEALPGVAANFTSACVSFHHLNTKRSPATQMTRPCNLMPPSRRT
jgi:hypothetical protein